MRRRIRLLISSVIDNDSSLGRTGTGLFNFFDSKKEYSVFLDAWKESNKYSLTPRMLEAMEKMNTLQVKKLDVIIRKCDPYSATILANRAKVVIPYIYYDNKNLSSKITDALKQLKAIVVPSEFTRDRFISFGLNPDQVHVIPLGVDLSVFKPGLDKKSNRKCTFINYGEQGRRKGTDILIEAFADAFRDQPQVRLKLIVSNIGARTLVEGLIKKHNLNNIDLIIGKQIEYLLVEHIQEADYFVAPTRDDSFGMCGLESMACGLPVIATKNTGYSQYVNSSNGIELSAVEIDDKVLSKEVSVERVSSAMKIAAEDCLTSRRMYRLKSANALNTAKAHSWEKLGEKFESIINMYYGK